jgi:hypothetical protein
LAHGDDGSDLKKPQKWAVEVDRTPLPAINQRNSSTAILGVEGRM